MVISHPTQHWVPVYVALAKHPDISLNVFYVGENGVKPYNDEQFNQTVQWDIPLLEGYDYEFLEHNKIIDSFGFFEVDSKHITRKLDEFNPDYIWLHGYSHKVNWRALFTKPDHSRVIYSSDSNLTDPRSFWKKVFKQVFVRLFFMKCHDFLCIGPSNEKYIKHYTSLKSSISCHQVPFPVDIKRILDIKNTLPNDSRNSFRKSLGISKSATVLLFLGKLVPHKRPQDIIEAVSLINDESLYCLFVGSGTMQQELENLAKDYQLKEKIKMVGFVNQSTIPSYIDVSDILVLPSQKEPFGAVVSEVLPFGLPVIVSDSVGAIGSSALVGENALAYECGNVSQLAEKINQIKNNSDLYTEMSKSSLALSKNNDSQSYADVIMKICGLAG